MHMDNGNVLAAIFKNPKPIIGMVHLRPLPGSPLYDPTSMNMDLITKTAVEEAVTLQSAGVDGLQIENIWDYPYLKGNDIGHETTAALAVATARVREAVDIPVGINCHLNGGIQSLAAACASGARWIRVFAWVNAYISHAGFVEGIGGHLSRYRDSLHCHDVKCFCDVNVKHGSHFIVSDRSVAEQAHDAESEGAEVLIVTGFETGKAPTPDKVRDFVENVRVPVLIGSGTTRENVANLLKYADGAIVGSYFKKDGNWKMPVDEAHVRAFMKSVEALRRQLS